MVFIFLHICWGVLWFDAFEKKSYIKGAIVLVSHIAAAFLVSCLMTRTDMVSGVYIQCVPAMYIVVLYVDSSI